MAEPNKDVPETEISPEVAEKIEAKFQEWYASHAQNHGLSPDPDDPENEYNFRHAFAAGASPNKEGQWPSEFRANVDRPDLPDSDAPNISDNSTPEIEANKYNPNQVTRNARMAYEQSAPKPGTIDDPREHSYQLSHSATGTPLTDEAVKQAPTWQMNPYDVTALANQLNRRGPQDWATNPNNVTELAKQNYDEMPLSRKLGVWGGPETMLGQRGDMRQVPVETAQKAQAPQFSSMPPDPGAWALQKPAPPPPQTELTQDQLALIQQAQANARAAQAAAAQARVAQRVPMPMGYAASVSDERAKTAIRPAKSQTRAFLEALGHNAPRQVMSPRPLNGFLGALKRSGAI